MTRSKSTNLGTRRIRDLLDTADEFKQVGEQANIDTDTVPVVTGIWSQLDDADRRQREADLEITGLRREQLVERIQTLWSEGQTFNALYCLAVYVEDDRAQEASILAEALGERPW